MYYEVHDVINHCLLTMGALLIISHVQVSVLCDEGASSSTLALVSFRFLNGTKKEKGRY